MFLPNLFLIACPIHMIQSIYPIIFEDPLLQDIQQGLHQTESVTGRLARLDPCLFQLRHPVIQ